jgi:hypothetical protein
VDSPYIYPVHTYALPRLPPAPRRSATATQEIENGPVYEGQLSAYYMDGKGERCFVASLSGARPKMIRMLPELYEPVLVARSAVGVGTSGC